MADCTSCGAPITHAKNEYGENIPLEKWTDPDGPNRYRVVELGPPLIVALVSPSSRIDAYPDHRNDCPGHGDGRL